ncbi:MAG: hypothetical protein ACFB4I_05025 [Cyanophyceae cyanobacterium]
MSKIAAWIPVLLLLANLPASAQPPVSAACRAPLTTNNIFNEETISATGSTIPSLWWAKAQFDPFSGKLISSWRADRQARRIDLVVNRQLWSLLNYLKRYRFVNNFGTVARDYQYNLRVFNQQQQCLATYTCDFSAPLPRCQIEFTPLERNTFQVEAE